MRYRVEWYYDIIRKWMAYDTFFFRGRAIACAAKKIAHRETVTDWRVIDLKTGELVVEMHKPAELTASLENER